MRNRIEKGVCVCVYIMIDRTDGHLHIVSSFFLFFINDQSGSIVSIVNVSNVRKGKKLNEKLTN
jgi:hypothetical protein